MISIPFIIRYAQQLAIRTPEREDPNEDHASGVRGMVAEARCTRETRVGRETTDDE